MNLKQAEIPCIQCLTSKWGSEVLSYFVVGLAQFVEMPLRWRFKCLEFDSEMVHQDLEPVKAGSDIVVDLVDLIPTALKLSDYSYFSQNQILPLKLTSFLGPSWKPLSILF